MKGFEDEFLYGARKERIQNDRQAFAGSNRVSSILCLPLSQHGLMLRPNCDPRPSHVLLRCSLGFEMTFGIGKGFHRLLAVMTIVWAIFCAVVFPMQRQWEGQKEALAKYRSDNKNCDQLIKESPEWSLTKDCYEQSVSNMESNLTFYSLSNFWMLDALFWKVLILAIFLPPVALYVTAIAGRWVWRGFKTQSKALDKPNSQ